MQEIERGPFAFGVDTAIITGVMCRHDYRTIQSDGPRPDFGTGGDPEKAGAASGSVLEWDEKGGEVVVRRASRYTSAQVHEALFGASHTLKAKVDAKEGIRKRIRQRYARD